jgi:hypothetical protein
MIVPRSVYHSKLSRPQVRHYKLCFRIAQTQRKYSNAPTLCVASRIAWDACLHGSDEAHWKLFHSVVTKACYRLKFCLETTDSWVHQRVVRSTHCNIGAKFTDKRTDRLRPTRSRACKNEYKRVRRLLERVKINVKKVVVHKNASIKKRPKCIQIFRHHGYMKWRMT